MSKTKRWLEKLWESGEIPHPQNEIPLNIDTPYTAECPNCTKKFEQKLPIPKDVICPTCLHNEYEI